MSEHHRTLVEQFQHKFIGDQHKLHSKRHKFFMKHSIGIFITGLAMMTAAFALASAAEPRKYVAVEAEGGARTGVAAVVNDTSVSGKKYVGFPKPADNPPDDPPPPTTKVRRFPGDPNPKLYDKAYWGSSYEGGDPKARHEDPTGVSLSIRRTFFDWSEATNTTSGKLYSTVSTDLSRNRLPQVSIKTPGWQAVANGTYDTQLDNILKKLDSYGKPVWFTVHHEPEGGPNSSGPDDPGGAPAWRAMQKRVRQRMDAVGTKNIAFMPILMAYSWNKASGRTPNDWWVDGIWDAYCVDHYHDNTNGSPLKTQWYDFVAWVEAKGLPFCTAEWGNRGTDAAAGQEMRDFWNWSFNNNKDMIGYSYFDSGRNSPSGSWMMTGEPLKVFQDILKNDARVQRISGL